MIRENSYNENDVSEYIDLYRSTIRMIMNGTHENSYSKIGQIINEVATDSYNILPADDNTVIVDGLSNLNMLLIIQCKNNIKKLKYRVEILADDEYKYNKRLAKKIYRVIKKSLVLLSELSSPVVSGKIYNVLDILTPNYKVLFNNGLKSLFVTVEE